VLPGRQSVWGRLRQAISADHGSDRGYAGRSMGKLTTWFVVIVVLAALGGAAFLALWNPPVPSSAVEKVLPDARFPK
jgi:hypothetical protein